ncbi:hypothetical protein [Rhodopirellula sallentina]|uniref:hypothetical protein n=1 Tax=Rhodopirellula sallentina TaxID=1263869 RepID=UPI0005C7BDA8|nr:hypothetical protein [Rhodopirellula sallentina]
MNPYEAPSSINDAEPVPRVGLTSPRWLVVSLIATTIAYAVIPVLLLSSTPGDRFYGYFYLPITLLLAVLIICILRSLSFSRVIATATCLAQCLLGTWLTWSHGFGYTTTWFAIVPTIAIGGVSITCLLRPFATELHDGG